MRAEHPGSAAKAALNDCPLVVARGAHLAAFVSCNPLFGGSRIGETARIAVGWIDGSLGSDRFQKRPRYCGSRELHHE